jgi:MOSC domain-containing protein YiiM
VTSAGPSPARLIGNSLEAFFVNHGRIVAIFIGPEPGGSMQPTGEVRAVPGMGLEGDRYWQGGPHEPRHHGADREVTLIESEAIDALVRDEGVAFDPSESRRNMVTRGVALNHLVGQEFRVGGVRLRGLRLCEPCAHLEKLTRCGVREGLLHRGGLRAQVLEEGLLHVGDAVEL